LCLEGVCTALTIPYPFGVQTEVRIYAICLLCVQRGGSQSLETQAFLRCARTCVRFASRVRSPSGPTRFRRLVRARHRSGDQLAACLWEQNMLEVIERYGRTGVMNSVPYTARARKLSGTWEVTVAGIPAVRFCHPDPTVEMVAANLAEVLDRPRSVRSAPRPGLRGAGADFLGSPLETTSGRVR
jgi:hypothetical protein